MGIPVQLWGTGGAKRVEDLWSELGTGETVLTDSPVERRVSFVNVVVRRGNKTLTEVGQVLATGHYRRRQWPPGEKMLPSEDAETAAYRCVEEELGVSRGTCRIVPGSRTEGSRTAESLSYPGLVTRYRTNRVEMEIPNLPATAFSTPETDGSGDSAVLRHDWDWLES
jgi:hypothetical protein